MGPGLTEAERVETALTALAAAVGLAVPEISAMIMTKREVGNIPHIFSHINMTYHILHLTLPSSSPPPLSKGVWLDETGVETANIGTAVKKVWTEVYGAWGKFDSETKSVKTAKRGKKEILPPEGKVVKKIMMPAMPVYVKPELP